MHQSPRGLRSARALGPIPGDVEILRIQEITMTLQSRLPSHSDSEDPGQTDLHENINYRVALRPSGLEVDFQAQLQHAHRLSDRVYVRRARQR